CVAEASSGSSVHRARRACAKRGQRVHAQEKGRVKDLSISAVLFGQTISASTSAVRLHTDGNNFRDTADFPVEPPHVAWSVYVADREGFRTVAADFDASKGDADTDARDLIAITASCGLRAVLVESGPTGGRHVDMTFTKWLPR